MLVTEFNQAYCAPAVLFLDEFLERGNGNAVVNAKIPIPVETFVALVMLCLEARIADHSFLSVSSISFPKHARFVLSVFSRTLVYAITAPTEPAILVALGSVETLDGLKRFALRAAFGFVRHVGLSLPGNNGASFHELVRGFGSSPIVGFQLGDEFGRLAHRHILSVVPIPSEKCGLFDRA